MHPDLQAQNHDVLDDMPSPVLPPLPPDQRPFEFSSFIRRTGGDTTSLLSAIRETDAHLPPGPIIVQFEPEDSWERPGVRAFGRVNGGTVFEAAYLLDKSSVPMLSVFYADKSHLKGTSHHPIYRKYILCILHIVCIFYIFVNTLKQVKHPPHL